jgi:hypothetical protein
MSWTQPICVPCWYKENPGRTPTQLIVREDERCCKCGETTRGGIYIRIDPTTVPYPTEEP